MDRDLYNRLKEISQLKWETKPKLEALLSEYQPYSYRSTEQNRGLHKFFNLLAEELNTKGKDMKLVLRDDVDIWWTTESVKRYIWKPVMKAMTGKDSTKELSKTNMEIDKVHEQIMKWLGEKHGIEYIEFPHLKDGEELKGKTKIKS